MKKNGTDTFGYVRKRNNQTKSRTCMKYWKHLYFVFAKAFLILKQRCYDTVHRVAKGAYAAFFSTSSLPDLTVPLHFNTHFYRNQDWSRLQQKYHFSYHRHLIPFDHSETMHWSMLSSTDTVILKTFSWRQIIIISNFITNDTSSLSGLVYLKWNM